MDAETTDRPAASDDPRLDAASIGVAPPYDALEEGSAWPEVFASIGRHTRAALADQETRSAPSRAETESLGRLVLSAVVADVLEPRTVATLLTLHREAVTQRLLPDVPGEEGLAPDVPLLEARRASSPALLAVEAGVYGIVGDVVRATLAARA
ncbi:MAG: hypothetical protein JWP75_335 [Frondihabitans sp.]|nr:hypothetical protein [Frondihabitans sp.]